MSDQVRLYTGDRDELARVRSGAHEAVIVTVPGTAIDCESVRVMPTFRDGVVVIAVNTDGWHEVVARHDPAEIGAFAQRLLHCGVQAFREWEAAQ